MRFRPSRTAVHYFAATSTVPLATVCSHLQRAFATSQFEFDSHAHWEYGRASSEELAFNITRCSDSETIEKWIEGTPSGVNYQAIIWCPEWGGEGVPARLEEELGAAFGGRAEHFLSSSGSGSTEAPDKLASLSDDPPSGFSLPLTWFIAVGLAAVGVIVFRSCSA